MRSLLKKELNAFFGSLLGYLIIAFFLVVNGLFLWVFDGNYNIFNSTQASLKPYFELAPWVFLFLIPATTMRLFSEEKKMGTFEMLLTHPIPNWKIVAAKYLSALVVVGIALLPTLLYFLSIHFLGEPVGNIDAGSTWGSYIGLLFLAAIYIAIGLFASALTTNQVVAFLMGTVLCFVFYIGFDFISDQSSIISLSNFLQKIGINEHYLSISRGIIDSRDITYYLYIVLFFGFLSSLSFKRKLFSKNNFKTSFFPFIVFSLLAIFLIQQRIFRVDLTEDKRYTLSENSKQIINDFEDPIYAEIYLSGELPFRLKNLQKALIEKIEEYNAQKSRKIFYHLIDPYEDVKLNERQDFFNQLMDNGINPVDLRVKNQDGESVKRIFPGMVLNTDKKGIAINLLLNNQNISADINLNNSVEQLEYQITRALRYLSTNQKPSIGFLTGHGEADRYHTADLALSLSENYQIDYLTCNDLWTNDSLSTLMIIDPQNAFSDSDKLAIDQFAMKGGKIVWAIDPVTVNSDSLTKNPSTIALAKDLNLKDLLFKYGIRFNLNLVQDVRCMSIPVISSSPGQQNNFVPAKWYYYPLASPTSKHPISRNVNLVSTNYISTIDLVGNSENIEKTILIESSEYSRIDPIPTVISLNEVNLQPSPLRFNQKQLPLGVIVEGQFQSLFTNRITTNLGVNRTDLIIQNKNGKMVFLADANLLTNEVRWRNGKPQIEPLGYDRYSGQSFGNKDLIINTIDYLNDDMGIVSLRNNIFKIRLLNKIKIKEQKTTWQLINLVVPNALLALFGIAFYIIRRRKYGQKHAS